MAVAGVCVAPGAGENQGFGKGVGRIAGRDDCGAKVDEADADAHLEAAQALDEYRMRFIEVEAEWKLARIRAEGGMLAVFSSNH